MLFSFRDALQTQYELLTEGMRYGHALPTYRQLALTYQMEVGVLSRLMLPGWSRRVDAPVSVDVIAVQQQAARVLAALLAMHVDRLPEAENDGPDGLDRSLADIQGQPAPNVETGLYELVKKGHNVGLQSGIWGLSRVLILFNIRLETLLGQYQHHVAKQGALYRTLAARG